MCLCVFVLSAVAAVLTAVSYIMHVSLTAAVWCCVTRAVVYLRFCDAVCQSSLCVACVHRDPRRYRGFGGCLLRQGVCLTSASRSGEGCVDTADGRCGSRRSALVSH